MNTVTRIHKYPLIFILQISISLVFFSTGFTQGDPGLILNRAAQYQLGDKDQILMNVNVWGYVSKPGQYVVPRNTDLITLISFAGGPGRGADLSEVSIIRAGELLKVAGDTEGANGKNDPAAYMDRNGDMRTKVPIVKVNVEQHLKKGDIGKIPILSAGDTVIISESSGSKVTRFLGFNSIVSIITAMASVAIIVERL